MLFPRRTQSVTRVAFPPCFPLWTEICCVGVSNFPFYDYAAVPLPKIKDESLVSLTLHRPSLFHLAQWCTGNQSAGKIGHVMLIRQKNTSKCHDALTHVHVAATYKLSFVLSRYPTSSTQRGDCKTTLPSRLLFKPIRPPKRPAGFSSTATQAFWFNKLR